MNRINEVAQLKSQIASMEEQLKDVSGDLQTARRESVHDRQRVAVEKFKTELNEIVAKSGADRKVAASKMSGALKLEEQKLKSLSEEIKEEVTSGAVS